MEGKKMLGAIIAYAVVALNNLIECEVPVTKDTMFYEIQALYYEYTAKEILKKAKKL